MTYFGVGIKQNSCLSNWAESGIVHGARKTEKVVSWVGSNWEVEPARDTCETQQKS